MPASSINVVELVLNMKDADPIVKQLGAVDKAAYDIVKNIKGSLENISSSTAEMAKNVGNKIEEVNASLASKTLESAKDLGKWVGSTMTLLGEEYPRVAKAVNEYFTTPAIEAYDAAINIGIQLSKMTVAWYTKTAKTISKLTSNVSDGASQLYNRMKTQAIAVSEHVKKNYPKTHAVITGVWKAAKTSALAYGTFITTIPALMVKAIKFTQKYKDTVIASFKKIGLSIAGGVKALKDIGAKTWDNIKKVSQYIDKVTGLGYVFRKIKKLATITVAVTGITATLGLLKGFFMNANTGFAGLFGGGSAFQIFMDQINAALMPLADELTKLAVKVAPLLVQILSPLIEILIKAVKFVSKIVERFIAGSGKFSSFMDSISTVITDLAKMVFEVLVTVGRYLMPLIKELLKYWMEIFKNVAEVVFPLLKDMAEKIFPILGQIFRALAPVVMELMKALGDAVGPILQALVEAVVPIVETLVELLPTLMPALTDLFKMVGMLLKALAPLIGIMLKMSSIIATKLLAPALVKVLSWILTALARVAELIGYAINTAVELLGEKFIGTFEKIVTAIGSFFGWLSGIVEATFGGIFGFLKDSWQTLKEFFGFDSLAEGISGVFGTLVKAVQGPISIIRQLINSSIIKPLRTVMTYDLPVIGSLADAVGISAPEYLARGGIVTRPVSAVVGEAGPEMVIPLKKEIISQIVPAMLPPIPTEITARVNMPQIPAPTITLPEQLTTTYGQRIAESLTRVEVVLKEMKEIAAKPSPPPAESLATDMPFSFTLKGFFGS